jgi:hypothetical protein
VPGQTLRYGLHGHEGFDGIVVYEVQAAWEACTNKGTCFLTDHASALLHHHWWINNGPGNTSRASFNAMDASAACLLLIDK